MRTQQALFFSILLLVDSMHYVFARLLLPRMQPVSSSFWVLAVASFEVALYAALTGRFRWRAFRAHRLFFLAVGFLVAASTLLSYESIAFLDVGTASLLGKTTTLFTVMLGVWWLRERLRAVQWAGAAVALAGVALIAFQPGDYLRLGTFLVLLSSLFYAVHTAVVKRWGEQIDFLDFFVWRLLATAAFLLLFAGASNALELPSGTTWLLLIVTGTVDVTLSRTLYYLTLRRLPMSVHAIILTLSPVVSIAVALLLFDTFPSAAQMWGGALVLLGVLLVTYRNGREHGVVQEISSDPPSAPVLAEPRVTPSLVGAETSEGCESAALVEGV